MNGGLNVTQAAQTLSATVTTKVFTWQRIYELGGIYDFARTITVVLKDKDE
jgi:hypothetical protein